MEEEKYKVVGLFNHDKPKNIHSDWDNTGRLDVTLVKRLEEGQIRNFSDSWGDEGLPYHLADLRVRCFYTVKDRQVKDVFGWKVEYHPHAVDLARAEKMIKTLRKIERKLEAISAQWGRPESFGEFVQRVLKVIGADGMVRRIGDARGASWSYDGSKWGSVRLVDVKFEILSELADYQESIKAAAVGA